MNSLNANIRRALRGSICFSIQDKVALCALGGSKAVLRALRVLRGKNKDNLNHICSDFPTRGGMATCPGSRVAGEGSKSCFSQPTPQRVNAAPHGRSPVGMVFTTRSVRISIRVMLFDVPFAETSQRPLRSSATPHGRLPTSIVARSSSVDASITDTVPP